MFYFLFTFQQTENKTASEWYKLIRAPWSTSGEDKIFHCSWGTKDIWALQDQAKEL